WRPLVHVEDVADAFIATLRAPVESIHDQAFNIGITQENFRVKALAEMIVTEIPGTRLDMAKGAQADERTYRVNCDKARSVLKDWKPRWETRHGIRNLNQIYNQYGLQQQDFEGSRYQRVAHLQKLMASGAIQQDLRKPVAEKAE
ncbi:MAG: NAD-dependent dehydratase, partial [Bacteroidetes bacterium]